MSCSRMESKILDTWTAPEREQRLRWRTVSTCAACRVRVNEFRTVNVLLDELPMIEPSAALICACMRESRRSRRSRLVACSCRHKVAFAAAMLRGDGMGRVAHADNDLSAGDIDRINQNMTVLENYDVIRIFATERLPQPCRRMTPAMRIRINNVKGNETETPIRGMVDRAVCSAGRTGFRSRTRANWHKTSRIISVEQQQQHPQQRQEQRRENRQPRRKCGDRKNGAEFRRESSPIRTPIELT